MKKLTNKQRYINLMQKVNNVTINESVFDTDTAENALYSSFEKFLNKNLNIVNTKTVVSKNESFVEIECVDDDGNKIIFNFKAVVDELNQDGVFNVNEAELFNFEYKKSDGTDTIEINKNALDKFNQKYSKHLVGIVSDYIDVEDQEPDEDESLYEGDESYKNAIKIIESINERRRAWVDGSKAVEVKRECQLGGKNDGTSKACNQGEINNLKFSDLSEEKDNKYPNPMPKEFSGSGKYPKLNKKPKTSKKKIKEEYGFGVPGYSQIRIPQDNIQEFDDDTADILLGFEPRNVGEGFVDGEEYTVVFDGTSAYIKEPDEDVDEFTEVIGTYNNIDVAQRVADKYNDKTWGTKMTESDDFDVNTGDRFEDTEGNQYTVNSKSNDKVNIRSNDGNEQEVTPDALKFTKKLN